MTNPTPSSSLSRRLPTGTITFLFSDIEGSTARWERDRNAMSAAIVRHDVLLRSAIESHGGYVFKTVGDAFCAAFHTAHDAIKAALDAQSALSREDFSAVGGLRVRIGLHSGQVDERDGDYFGPTVNRVARLMAVGHGGQVLISAATAELIKEGLPRGATLTDLGSHRLKDLSLPERLWQLSSEGLPADFPPPASLEARPNNLPIQYSSFRGREGDLAEIETMLEDTALLTLTGAGGIGKTRLALQAGADLLDRFPDGVWMIELAPI